MIRIATAISIGIVLAAAFWACAQSLPTAQDLADYHSTESACVQAFDARPAIDECRAVERRSFCAKFSNACASIDAGGQ